MAAISRRFYHLQTIGQGNLLNLALRLARLHFSRRRWKNVVMRFGRCASPWQDDRIFLWRSPRKFFELMQSIHVLLRVRFDSFLELFRDREAASTIAIDCHKAVFFWKTFALNSFVHVDLLPTDRWSPRLWEQRFESGCGLPSHHGGNHRSPEASTRGSLHGVRTSISDRGKSLRIVHSFPSSVLSGSVPLPRFGDSLERRGIGRETV